MATIAIQRVRREFKEVLKSEEVHLSITFSWNITKSLMNILQLVFQFGTLLSLILSQSNKNLIKLELVNDSFTELSGEITGPPDTPYNGGHFKLEIKIPETYPFTPPKVRLTRSNCLVIEIKYYLFSTTNLIILFNHRCDSSPNSGTQTSAPSQAPYVSTY